MVSLELLIDASGMPRGAAEANRALDGVKNNATQTTQSVANVGRALTASGSFTSATTSIASAANAFSSLNLSAAGFASSGALLNIGRAVNDFGQLGGRIGTLAAGFARLNPYLLVASTGLSAVSAVMSVLADDTQRAANAYADLIANQNKVQSLGKVADLFGDAGLRNQAGRQYLENLRSAAVEIYSSGRAPDVGELRGILGPRVSDTAFLNAARNAGIYSQQVDIAARDGRSAYSGAALSQPTTDQALAIIRSFAFQFAPDDASRRPERNLGPQYSSLIFADPTQRPSPFSPLIGNGVSLTPEMQLERDKETAQARADADRERLEQAAEVQRELNDQARQWGEHVGDGVADLLFGLRSAREIGAGLVADFARLGLREATGGLFAAVRNSFGTTAPQANPPAPGPAP